MLVAEEEGTPIGGAFGFLTDPSNATLRAIALVPDRRGRGLGGALLRAFERAAGALGAAHVSLGADEAVGFYLRHGYRLLLSLQWVHDASHHKAEAEALLGGPLKNLPHRHSSFGGVPQLSVTLDESSAVITERVNELAKALMPATS
ncbi:GNAT family N-acetyltransferase [Amycolatopsis pigmentata]|uniref:GNAT family N-acetyltransferase n=1 Tax=Amycolatopsis pigmentata TaxID=450801 RepID=A0ABW5FZA3_9PSEU